MGYCCGYCNDYYYAMEGNECVFKYGGVTLSEYQKRVDMSLAKLKMLCASFDEVLFEDKYDVSNRISMEFKFWFNFDRGRDSDIYLFGDYVYLCCRVEARYISSGLKVSQTTTLEYAIATSDGINYHVNYVYNKPDNSLYAVIPVEFAYSLMRASQEERAKILLDMFNYKLGATRYLGFRAL